MFARCCSLLLLALLARPVLAAPPTITSQADATKNIRMEVGQTRLLRFSQKITRVSVADPNVADVRVVTPLQVLVTGKGVGYTHLILWGDTDAPLVLAINCMRNLEELRTQIKELFPKEDVKVSSAGELVVLSGKVSDLRIPSRVAEVAKLHSEKLANLVEVEGDQQVQLEVRFAEVSRTGMRKLGLNFLWRDVARGYVGGLGSAGTGLGNTLSVEGTGLGGPPAVPLAPHGDAFNLFFSTGLSEFPFSAILSILAQEGLGKMLAEPTLVALSGQEAKFHAGGEVPILISQNFGNVSVNYKQFGVRLKFVPTVLGKRNVSLKVYAEVSEPDANAGVTLGGFRVPGFKSRSSETTIRLKDGQSFAIAGLLSDDTRSAVQKIPLLGEIPILGALFRSTSFQRVETEMLVVVRVHLVKPLRPDQRVPMPGELELNDVDDFQLFMLGSLSAGKRKQRKARRRREQRELREMKKSVGGPSGPIGFVYN